MTEKTNEDVKAPAPAEAAARPTADARRAILTGCVTLVKAQGLTGKGRDDAASYYMGGAINTLVALGIDLGISHPAHAKYLDVLEALAG